MQVTHTDLTDCFCLLTNSGNKIIKRRRYQICPLPIIKFGTLRILQTIIFLFSYSFQFLIYMLSGTSNMPHWVAYTEV